MVHQKLIVYGIGLGIIVRIKFISILITFIIIGCVQPILKKISDHTPYEIYMPLATIQGTVIDSITGKWIIGSTVVIKRNQSGWGISVTDSMGNYKIHTGFWGNIDVEVYHPNYETCLVNTFTRANEITIVNFSLKPNGFIDRQCGILSGEIYDFETNEPICGPNVVVMGSLIGGTCDYYGRYVIYKIPAGPHIIWTSCLGYDAAEDSNVFILPNQTTIRNFKLHPNLKNIVE